MHSFLLYCFWTVYTDTGNRNINIVAYHTRNNTGMGARRTAWNNNMIKIQALSEHLIHDFFHAAYIPQRTKSIGSSPGNNIWFPAFCFQFFSNFFHFSHHIGTAGNNGNSLYAKELEKKVITGSLRGVAVFYTFFKHKITVKPFLYSPG